MFDAQKNPLGRWMVGFLGAALVSSSLLYSAPAHAEVGNPDTNVTGKGIVGGALLGSELVLLVEAAFGVDPWWAYALGGGLGAIGGGIGGFFLAEADTGAAPMALLTAGLVLSIPTTLAVLNATSYTPPSDGRTDGSVARLRLPSPRSTSLVGFEDGEGWALHMPAVSVTEVYSRRMRLTYGLPSETEVRVPLLDVQF